MTVIFEGKLSGKDTDHPEFQKSLEYIRQNDIVVMKVLENNKELTETMDMLKNKGVKIEKNNVPKDY